MSTLSFAGLDFHRLSLILEAFGGKQCTEGCAASCMVCAEMRMNREHFFAQPFSSIVMNPPKLYRDVMVVAMSPVTYCMVITAYMAMLHHQDRLFDPKNDRYVQNDTWMREARPSRDIAHALYVEKWDVFETEMETVRTDPTATRLEVLQTLERLICYGLAIMAIVKKHAHEMTLENDEDTLRRLTDIESEKQMHEKGSIAIAEWVNISNGDQYHVHRDYNERMNKRHAEMMLQVEADRLAQTMVRLKLVLPAPAPPPASAPPAQEEEETKSSVA